MQAGSSPGRLDCSVQTVTRPTAAVPITRYGAEEPAGACAGLREGEQSTIVLGQWYATAVSWKPQVALFANEGTLLPVLTPLASAGRQSAPGVRASAT